MSNTSTVDLFPGHAVLSVFSDRPRVSIPRPAVNVQAIDSESFENVAVVSREENKDILVTLRDKKWQGKPVVSANDSVTIANHDCVTTIHDPDSVSIHGDYTKEIEAASPAPMVTCDLHDVSWTPQYAIHVGKESIVSLNAEIVAGVNWPVSRMTFHLVPTPQYARALAATPSESVEPSASYHYRVEQPYRLGDGSVPLETFKSVPTHRVIACNLNQTPTPVRQILFETNTRLPPGTANIFRDTDLIAQSSLTTRDSPYGPVASVDAGMDTKLFVNSAVYDDRVHVTFHSSHADPITVVLEYTVYDAVSVDPSPDTVDGDTFYWQRTVPPGQSTFDVSIHRKNTRE